MTKKFINSSERDSYDIPAWIDPRTEYYPLNRLEEEDYETPEYTDKYEIVAESVSKLIRAFQHEVTDCVGELYEHITEQKLSMPETASVIAVSLGNYDLEYLFKFDRAYEDAIREYNDAITAGVSEDVLAETRGKAYMFNVVSDFLEPIRRDEIENLEWDPAQARWNDINMDLDASLIEELDLEL